MGYLASIFRFLFSWIDDIVIWAIETVYNLLIELTNLTVFSDKLISTLGKRISVLIGVVFLFRAAFAIVQYIVNPDKSNDGQNGTSKIVFNVVISLGLLVSYNFIFKQAFILQGKILGVQTVEEKLDCEDNDPTCNQSKNSGVLERIIFGVGNINTSTNIQSAGELMTYAMYTAFVYPNPEVVGDECENVYTGGSNSSAKDNLNKCLNALENAGVDQETRYAFTRAIYEKSAYKLISNIILTDVSNARDEDGNNTGDSVSTFSYYAIISTICGCIVLLMLVNFCIDVSIRMIKLGFLQLIAPIPILSNMIPGQSKMLSKWAGECGKSFVDIFIKLLALYFAIFVIMAVLNTGIYDATTGNQVGFWSHPIIVIFVILGALMFAQQLPKLISSITGVSLEGNFSLNPMKKIGQSSLASAAVGFLGGGIAGGLSNAWAFAQNYKSLNQKPKDKLTDYEKESMSASRGIKTIFGGMFGGQYNAVKAGLKGGGKGSAFDALRNGLSASNQARTDRAAIRQFNAAAQPDDQYGFMQRNFYDPLNRAAGYKNKDAGIGHMDKEIKKIDRIMDDLDKAEYGAARIKEEFLLDPKTNFTEDELRHMSQYRKDYYDRLKNKSDCTDEEKQIIASVEKYNQITSNGLDTQLFDEEQARFNEIQARLDNINKEREKLRQEKSRLEDAQRGFAASQKNNN